MRPVTVIIPCYNEKDLILEKINNTVDQVDRDHDQILVVDGESTDWTHLRAQTAAQHFNKLAGRQLVEVLQAHERGKTAQINCGLKYAAGEIVVITDVDARLHDDCVAILEDTITRRVRVAGAYSTPAHMVWLDKLSWYISNYVRARQTLVTAPWVVGTCYAFHRSLLDEFPDSVIADDAHVALWANFQGYKTAYVPDAKVTELRNARTMREFYWHKARKANALLREFLRFVHRQPYAYPGWKAIYTKWLIYLLLVAGWTYPFVRQDCKLRRVT